MVSNVKDIWLFGINLMISMFKCTIRTHQFFMLITKEFYWSFLMSVTMNWWSSELFYLLYDLKILHYIFGNFLDVFMSLIIFLNWAPDAVFLMAVLIYFHSNSYTHCGHIWASMVTFLTNHKVINSFHITDSNQLSDSI